MYIYSVKQFYLGKFISILFTFSVEIAALITDLIDFALIFVISSPLQSKF